jgi:hypothetical protein
MDAQYAATNTRLPIHDLYRNEGDEMLIRKPLPLTFILSHVSLTRADVKVGLFRKLLDPADVAVLVERGLLNRGATASDLEQELTDGLPADWAAIGDPSEYPRNADPELRRAEEKWVYLELAWLWDHQSESSNPLDEIALLYDDFGFPSEIAHLVRWMPARPGQPVGETALIDNWSEYLAERGAKFGSIPPASAPTRESHTNSQATHE